MLTIVFSIHFNFSFLYLFDWKFVDQMSFFFFDKAKCAGLKNGVRLRGIARPSALEGALSPGLTYLIPFIAFIDIYFTR